MLQVPESIINTHISPAHYTQHTHSHLPHSHPPSSPIFSLTKPQPQIRHQPTSHPTRATHRRRQLTREPPLHVRNKAPLPLILHHREDPLPPFQHHTPHNPHSGQHFRHPRRLAHLHIKPKQTVGVWLQVARRFRNGHDAGIPALDVDCENDVIEGEPGLGGAPEAALHRDVADSVEAAVGDGGVRGAEVAEGGEVGRADGLPEVVGGHGNGP